MWNLLIEIEKFKFIGLETNPLLQLVQMVILAICEIEKNFLDYNNVTIFT